ncbi:MAG TPA: tetratricopeptide repeat protein, partial [Xanthomonadales bacterium]|nr:tetratricopeptide repeat protein [Xanthomonadales bacterium]
DRLPQMRAAAARAAELAPDAAMTLHALANVARGEGRFVVAEQLYARSIASDPSYPDVREDYAEFLIAVGRTDDALKASRELVALEPMVKVFWYRIAQLAILLDRDDLEAEAGRMLELDPMYYFGLTVPFRRAYTHGRFDEARREMERAYAINPEAVAAEWVLFRWSQKEPVITDEYARQAILGGYGWDYPQFAAFAGDADLYFAALRSPRDADKHFYAYNHLEVPAVAKYLADPRAIDVLRQAGFEAYWREKGWPALCRPLGEHDFECSHRAPVATAGTRP